MTDPAPTAWPEGMEPELVPELAPAQLAERAAIDDDAKRRYAEDRLASLKERHDEQIMLPGGRSIALMGHLSVAALVDAARLLPALDGDMGRILRTPEEHFIEQVGPLVDKLEETQAMSREFQWRPSLLGTSFEKDRKPQPVGGKARGLPGYFPKELERRRKAAKAARAARKRGR